jgi:hypothetical protein
MEELSAQGDGVAAWEAGLAHLNRQHEKDMTTLAKMLSKDHHNKQKSKLADRAQNRQVVMLQALKLQGASEEEIAEELARLGGTETMVQDELSAQLQREKDRMLKEAQVLQEAENKTASRYLELQESMASGNADMQFYSHPHLVLLPGLDSAVAAMSSTSSGKSLEIDPLGLSLLEKAWSSEQCSAEETEFKRDWIITGTHTRRPPNIPQRAETAGMHVGDRVVCINGAPVETDTVWPMLAGLCANDKYPIRILLLRASETCWEMAKMPKQSSSFERLPAPRNFSKFGKSRNSQKSHGAGAQAKQQKKEAPQVRSLTSSAGSSSSSSGGSRSSRGGAGAGGVAAAKSTYNAAAQELSRANLQSPPTAKPISSKSRPVRTALTAAQDYQLREQLPAAAVMGDMRQYPTETHEVCCGVVSCRRQFCIIVFVFALVVSFGGAIGIGFSECDGGISGWFSDGQTDCRGTFFGGKCVPLLRSIRGSRGVEQMRVCPKTSRNRRYICYTLIQYILFAGLIGLVAGIICCVCCVHTGLQRRRALSQTDVLKATPGAAAAGAGGGHDAHSFSISHSL